MAKCSLRPIAFLIALMMLFSLLSVTVSAKGATLTIDSPQALPAVGETFTVTVSISGNPGLCSAQYALAFDKAVVQCEKIKLGAVLSGSLSAENESAAAGAIIACASADAKTGDGVLSTYTFRVLSDGEPKFSLQDGTFTDSAGAEIITNVTISVSAFTQQPSSQQSIERPLDQPESPSVTESTQLFSDVPATYWCYEYIKKASSLGLVSGNPDGTFAPRKEMTRAEFAMMLYRLSGDDAPTSASTFSDVKEANWFYEPVTWAAEKGYATGYETLFNPRGNITRQEVVTMLYRYNGSASGMESMLAAFGVDNLSAFSDGAAVRAWAADAMRWAVYNGLIAEKTATTLSPLAPASRAEITTLLVRYAESAS